MKTIFVAFFEGPKSHRVISLRLGAALYPLNPKPEPRFKAKVRTSA